MKLVKIILLLFTLNLSVSAIESKKFMWENIEVTWVEDNKLPLYNITIYFADGALSDRSRKGETDLMFSLLSTGTNRFSLKEIADNLEFYGVSTGANVVHEYSTYSISGMTKDLIPTVKKVCHLFKDATFPAKELKKAKRNITSSMKNVVNNHGRLASMAFREINLSGSPFSFPVSGKLKTIKKVNSKNLQAKLNYFNSKVKKKIYITGPKSALNTKNVFLNECGWNPKAEFARNVNFKMKNKKRQIHLVTVPKANQAQVMLGKFLVPGEFENYEDLQVASQFLGGGFTSVLMKELRTKRGLTYSAYAYAGRQKDYGRSVISTFTQNSRIQDLLKVVDEILLKHSTSDVEKSELNKVVKSLTGSYIFQFEEPSKFMQELMFFDHVGLSHDRIFDFNKTIAKMTPKKLKDTIVKVFPKDGIDIVILGEKSLLKTLKKHGYKNIKVHSYKKFL